MIAFQTLKNVSVFITGPIVNIVIIIVTYYFSLKAGILFSMISPVTSFFIAPSPLLKAMPVIVLFIMFGNIVLCLGVNFLKKKNLILNLLISSTLKGVFMGITISLIIIPIMKPYVSLPDAALNTAKITFSLYQLINAYIASFISYVLIKRLADKVFSHIV